MHNFVTLFVLQNSQKFFLEHTKKRLTIENPWLTSIFDDNEFFLWEFNMGKMDEKLSLKFTTNIPQKSD